MLGWANQFNIFCYLDNQQYAGEGYECLLGVNARSSFDDTKFFNSIDAFLSKGSWYFGHLSYELKNNLYHTNDEHNQIGFPRYFFFSPQSVVALKDNELIIYADNADIIYNDILQTKITEHSPTDPIALQQRLNKEAYQQIIKKLQQHILRGDCYEINFCQEFFMEDAVIDPLLIFQKLVSISPTPFSAFYKLNEKYLVCASPERFLKKQGSKIISQPMKGTARRDLENLKNDEALKNNLYRDAKERAENVMIVDLVRNDLSRICKEATVKVDELFGIYTYPQVHQMVSTISGILKDDVSFSQIIDATYPMGSMTGAPKHKVMELIRGYEPVSRGLFSGSVGYIDPEGNFDFNVVIRSILYNALNKYVSYYAGSGITFYSDAGKEWEECLLKVEAIKKVLADYEPKS